jgi:hypothetical protein
MRISIKITFLVLTSSLMSCKVMYHPETVHVPMFTKKGELQAAIAYQNASIAYSPAKNFGLILSGNYRDKPLYTFSNDKSDSYYGTQKSITLAIGLYKELSFGSFEIFSGYGNGRCSISYDDYQGSGRVSSASRFGTLFIQPSLIVEKKDETKVAFSIKLYNVTFYNPGQFHNYQSDQNVSSGMLDQAVTLRGKFGPVAVKVQAGLSLPLSSGNNEIAGYYLIYGTYPLLNGSLELHFWDLFHRDED